MADIQDEGCGPVITDVFEGQTCECGAKTIGEGVPFARLEEIEMPAGVDLICRCQCCGRTFRVAWERSIGGDLSPVSAVLGEDRT